MDAVVTQRWNRVESRMRIRALMLRVLGGMVVMGLLASGLAGVV